MKNYPNQATELARIRTTLEVFRTLHANGQALNDDGVVGYALARARAYTFRGFDYTQPNVDAALEARIVAEQNKASGSQGARTFAREMRRTLSDLGWLDGAIHLTPDGVAFLSSLPGSEDERTLLRDSLLNVEVDPGPSHPARILLRLLAIAPSPRREGLELALEAQDDSEAEFQRVRNLYEMSSAARGAALAGLNATASQIANAKKIFPSLARAAGLVEENPPQTYRLTAEGMAVLAGYGFAVGDGGDPGDGQGPPPPAPPSDLWPPPPGGLAADLEATAEDAPVEYPAPVPPTDHMIARNLLKTVGPESIALAVATSEGRTLTPEQQQAAQAKLASRANRHQEIVRLLAERLAENGGSLYEDPMDVLWVPDGDGPVQLFEVKTVVGDAPAQVRYAVGQLLFYEYFDVQPNFEGREIQRTVVTDHLVASDLAQFTQSNGVGMLALNEAGWTPQNSRAADLEALLGPPLHDG